MEGTGNRITFGDIIGNNLLHLDEFTGADLLGAFVVLLAALGMGLVIYFVYRKMFRGVLYNPSFAKMLTLMTVLTAMIIVTISSNIILSLGMVGALSIVRYRTAIKDPLDLMYIFWAIATGIAVGAGLLLIALIGAALVILCLMLMNKTGRNGKPYVLIIHCDSLETENRILHGFGRMRYEVKSQTLRPDDVELVIEVNIEKNSMKLLEALRTLDGVTDVSVVQYNGNYSG